MAQSKISIDYPASLADALQTNRTDAEQEVRTAAIVKLYELGRLSSGVAARFLELSRIEFIEMLTDYNVSIFDETDLMEDLNNA